ncbi:MAG: hypothetical protein J7M18_06245, partial [Candidatus Eremiobacteraeota bacterium]|nr:hypothetical protein [Candidatus Eremiobacteraeota bacterium]
IPEKETEEKELSKEATEEKDTEGEIMLTLEEKPEFLRQEYRYGDIALFHVTSYLKRVQTKLFKVDLLEAAHLDKCLILNNRLKLAKIDEHVFYETLVHPAMCLHPRPVSVLLLGGGGGGALREILRHRLVEKVIMLERDLPLLELCKKDLLFLELEESLADPRVELVTDEDPVEYLNNLEEKFDVVIFDLNEPVSDQPSDDFLNMDFYKLIESKTKNLGIMVTPSCPIYHPFDENPSHRLVLGFMKELFPRVYGFLEYLTSHHALYGFIMGSRTFSPASINREEIDRRLAERNVKHLKYYVGYAHQRLFSLPVAMRQALENPEI